jgi:serine/threonine protein phosphatase PrpC
MLTSTVATLHNNAAHGEDRYLVRTLSEQMSLDAVTDGVTSRRGGEASRWLVDALAAASLASPDDVLAVLEAVNQHCYQRGMGHFFLTTVSVALFLDGRLYIMRVGDSPVLLVRSDASQPLPSRASGVVHTSVARAIGTTSPLRQVYRAEVLIKPGDRLVLATDGITNIVTPQELTQVVQDAETPDAAAQQIRTMITARQAERQWRAGSYQDDWTAIFRFFTSEERWSSGDRW